jgi:hypothetical protein
MSTNYNSIDLQPLYGQAQYNSSSGYITPMPPRKRSSNWVRIAIPILLIVIVGAVVGGIIGSHKKHNSSATSSAAAASSAASAKTALGRFATATDSEFLVPIYVSTTDTAVFTTPTFVSTNNPAIAWPQDPFQPAQPQPTSVRPDRPRLIAPAYKWAALPELIQNDPYLQGWNATIFGNASDYYSQPPVQYFLDGSSGILDNSRDVKMRIKAFAYVYRMTNDTTWVDRAWVELQNAAGNGTSSFGPAVDRWNSQHFLDVAEMTAAFAIAYDWMYDAWTADQKASIMFTMIEYGLSLGVNAFANPSGASGWWTSNITGNWNCVCNSGMTMGALALLGDDTSGNAAQLLGLTIDNANENCVYAVSPDGTWAETANYWYFGTTGHAEMASSLLTATGSSYGLMSTNSNFNFTGMYHMFVQGSTTLFNYGDTGPNKYSTTSNSMLFYADQFSQPQYALFQREQWDAAEPTAMFWYDPTVSGAFWDGQPLDAVFDNSTDQWVSMRSSWTDFNALYVAMKAGTLQGHQTHNDLDCGDFVLDAQGQRWFGELGSGDYNSIGYFSNDTQGSDRWLYYRKMTEGQNTILVNQANQNVLAQPTIQFGSSGTEQGSSTVFDVPNNSTAFFTADLSSAYFDVTSFQRGIRTINTRKQVLIQDDITAQGPIQWRAHTNATVTISSSGTTATLSLGGETMEVTILSPTSGATFTTSEAVRFPTDPTPPQPDQPNPGVTVLIISLPAGTYSLQVLFNPQWPGMSPSDFVTPNSVPITSWSLTSHP